MILRKTGVHFSASCFSGARELSRIAFCAGGPYPLPMPDWKARAAADLPDRLILFDGVCVLCAGWVQFVLKRDAEKRFRFTSIQSPYGQALAKRFGISVDAPETNAVIIGGAAHFKSDSALAALSDLPRWRWTRALRSIPKAWRDWCYDRIARNRYRLFGKSETCLMPAPELKARFIEELP